MQTVVNIMREMIQRGNKLIHKKDIFAVISHIHNQDQFEGAVERLLQDGTVYTTYDNEILTLDV